MAFFIFCNVLNRKNKNELDNCDKYGSLGGGGSEPPPLGFSVTPIPLRPAGVNVLLGKLATHLDKYNALILSKNLYTYCNKLHYIHMCGNNIACFQIYALQNNYFTCYITLFMCYYNVVGGNIDIMSCSLIGAEMI